MINQHGQKREGQAYKLPKSANTDPRATHVAIAKPGGNAGAGGFRYFCRFDPTSISPQQGIPIDQVKGTYWIVPCSLYGSCYNGCSLWQGGFEFIPLDEYKD